ncbi:SDR family oxidoreductase [Paraneptunicella aestuarii]|uniref:SDR family oxidoreductase n=1 Tax=Paraneptunicella aestuarii TaxID=2831148 RepID=UPI001E39C867|nr:SDR family oxidoreductase [Paraneptunicella aestuarii]UAA39546.1 SDR family oxidoreductase [Paraneptunicella aestuarii]
MIKTGSSAKFSADLSNKRVVITGAAGLLGTEYSRTLASCGATLELVDIDIQGLEQLREQLREQLTSKFPENVCHIHAVDITDESQVSELASRIANSLSDDEELALINNAAIDAKVGGGHGKNLSRLENFSLQQWQREIDVGLTGALLWSKHLGTVMAQRGSGIIVNVASDLGVIAPNQNLYKQDDVADDLQNVKPVTYSVIKHGLIGLTKYLATYWPQQGVRCNAIAPGGVFNQQPDEFVAKVSSLIPMGRMAKVDEYNGAMQFLLSDASQYMNGHVLVMDGGRTVW